MDRLDRHMLTVLRKAAAIVAVLGLALWGESSAVAGSTDFVSSSGMTYDVGPLLNAGITMEQIQQLDSENDVGAALNMMTEASYTPEEVNTLVQSYFAHPPQTALPGVPPLGVSLPAFDLSTGSQTPTSTDTLGYSCWGSGTNGGQYRVTSTTGGYEGMQAVINFPTINKVASGDSVYFMWGIIPSNGEVDIGYVWFKNASYPYGAWEPFANSTVNGWQTGVIKSYEVVNQNGSIAADKAVIEEISNGLDFKEYYESSGVWYLKYDNSFPENNQGFAVGASATVLYTPDVTGTSYDDGTYAQGYAWSGGKLKTTGGTWEQWDTAETAGSGTDGGPYGPSGSLACEVVSVSSASPFYTGKFTIDYDKT